MWNFDQAGCEPESDGDYTHLCEYDLNTGECSELHSCEDKTDYDTCYSFGPCIPDEQCRAEGGIEEACELIIDPNVCYNDNVYCEYDESIIQNNFMVDPTC